MTVPPDNSCSFCGKHERDVVRLIAGGPGVFICERCVALCNTLLSTEAGTGIPKTGLTESGARKTGKEPGKKPHSDTEPEFKIATTPAPLNLSPPAAGPPEFRPVDGRVLPRFAGISTFFRLPVWEKVTGADVAVLGIPFDGGTTFRPGARFAPREIRSASSLGRGYQTGTATNIFTDLKICDAGDVAAIPTDLKKTFEKIEARIGEVLEAGAIPLSVGGDHTITLPILRAFKKSKAKQLSKKPLAVVHFDAHFDTYPPAWDVDFHHGTTFRHLVQEGLVHPKAVVQIGIRGPLTSKEDLSFSQKHGFEVIMIDEVREKGPAAVGARLKRLTGMPVYVSFDIDGLDPAFAPGTGTPVPGGLTTHDCQVILRGLAGLDLVGFDMVEVSPAWDPAGITPLVAVTMMQEWLGALAVSRRAKR